MVYMQRQLQQVWRGDIYLKSGKVFLVFDLSINIKRIA